MPAHRQLWLISGKTRRILEHDTVAKNDHNCLRTHKHSAIKRKQRLTTYAVRSCSSSSGLFAAVICTQRRKAPHVLHNNNNCCREPTHTHTHTRMRTQWAKNDGDTQTDMPCSKRGQQAVNFHCKAQCAFEDSMIRGILQFTPHFAAGRVLHRCTSQEIHRCKLCFFVSTSLSLKCVRIRTHTGESDFMKFDKYTDTHVHARLHGFFFCTRQIQKRTSPTHTRCGEPGTDSESRMHQFKCTRFPLHRMLAAPTHTH